MAEERRLQEREMARSIGCLELKVLRIICCKLIYNIYIIPPKLDTGSSALTLHIYLHCIRQNWTPSLARSKGSVSMLQITSPASPVPRRISSAPGPSSSSPRSRSPSPRSSSAARRRPIDPVEVGPLGVPELTSKPEKESRTDPPWNLSQVVHDI